MDMRIHSPSNHRQCNHKCMKMVMEMELVLAGWAQALAAVLVPEH
jgi:hypothetical protein